MHEGTASIRLHTEFRTMHSTTICKKKKNIFKRVPSLPFDQLFAQGLYVAPAYGGFSTIKPWLS